MLRFAFDASLLPMIALVLAYRLGRADWLFDMTSFFRPQITLLALAFALLALLAGGRLRLLAGLAVFALALNPLFGTSVPRAAAAETGNLRVMTFNLDRLNEDFQGFVDRVAGEAPDIVVMQEATDPWRETIDALPGLVHVSDPALDTGVVVASRFPFTATMLELPPFARPDPRVGGGVPLRIELMRPGATRPLVIYALHAPTTRNARGWLVRNGYLDAIADLAARDAERGDVIVAGDWNTPIWSPALKRFLVRSGLATTERGAWPSPTRFFREVGLPPALGTPIDRVAVSRGIGVASLSVGGDIGSDHLPVTVDLALP